MFSISCCWNKTSKKKLLIKVIFNTYEKQRKGRPDDPYGA